jgi:ParB family chromosome partitioning protein
MAKNQKRILGRGLGALIKDVPPPPPPEPVAEGSGVLEIAVDRIDRNKMQPRMLFDPDAIAELSLSIKEHGVLQPILVRGVDDGYELIAGERRLRASIAAELKTVPAIVIEADDGVALELALVENLQRENLNAIEEAQGYEVLSKRFNLTQEEIATRVGKARASVSNAMRLLTLPDEVKQYLKAGRLQAGHAKVLGGLEIETEQVLYARRAVTETLSVRNLEKLIEKSAKGKRKPRARKDDIPANHITYLSDKLHGYFGTSIRLSPCKTYANGKKGKGTIEIDYFSNDDLDRILQLLNMGPDE